MEFVRRYILPGFIFQSVVIGGGYATGRELVEFFLPAGPLGGVLGLLVAGLALGVVLAAGFEFARLHRSYDYRGFCRALLGRGWFIFEIAFLALLLLILAVIGAAAGELARANFGVPPLAGTLGLLAAVALLTFKGTTTIQRVLAAWSVLLYAVYLALFGATFVLAGDAILANFEASSTTDGWAMNGIRYAGYNLAVLPAILFSVACLGRRRETIGAGLIAGALAVIPALMFYAAMMSLYPAIGAEPVPANALIAALHQPWLALLFQVVVFGTLIETGTALLHAVNERLDRHLADRRRALPRLARPAIALGILLIAVFAGERFGIIALIARGYGTLTLVFILVLVVPLLTVGVWKILRGSQRRNPGEAAS
jgi:uncharacterized membrane protein YkvI